ncbi:uncharacterized protein AB675_4354 [Cyphellophora attinorum]|uniref:Integrase zinc-binding domain-containing protein n=1 Tax=Cyphellophora attinorum TaxID=1664694 RepID=A0A0N0NJ27_9EURO|nr:uncharacterized protein AB675_4354 [Phialophora attinorum]KPI36501.1 hypothetical protein AB675_4354 [Phialophora attinorum]
MAEYAPGTSGQDRNSTFSNPSLISPHYTNGNGVNYFHPQFPPAHPPYSGAVPYTSYPAHYMLNTHASNPMYNAGMQYQLAPPSRSYAQSRTLSYPPSTGYHTTTLPTQRLHAPSQHRLAYAGEIGLGSVDIEAQDSVNEATALSEPILPVLEGYPVAKDFDQIVQLYVDELSPKKRDKALITARRARNIRTVLMDTKTTSVESAQFRFWVKKMFSLEQIGPAGTPKSICHSNKPVAVREKLFKILTRAHKACQHGGRDKTSLQVRRVYSWVPKELISRFVKACPTCRIRRPSRGEDVEMAGCDDGNLSDDDCPSPSSPDSRLTSVPSSKRGSASNGMPGFSATFAKQNRWMTDLPETKLKTDYYDTKPKHEYYDTMNYAQHDNHHEHYNSNRISQQLSNMSFSSASDHTSPTTGYPSSNVRTTSSNWHTNPAYSAYSVKADRHGEHIKQEHRM